MRRSAHIGINDYPGTGSDLAGCVNDARDTLSAAQALGYEESHELLDSAATRANILGLLERLASSLDYGDRLWVHYSGHGSYVTDRDGDEVDGRDEIICPHDITTAGGIRDDELYEIFRRTARGAQVVMSADSCHSGTLHRFAPALTSSLRRPRFLPPAVWASAEEVRALEGAADLPARGLMRRGALVMAACAPTEVTYDAVVDGRPCGIYTHVMLAALEAEGPATFRHWQRNIRGRLPSVDYPTHPELNGLSYQRGWTI
jgi:metacaspase-1